MKSISCMRGASCVLLATAVSCGGSSREYRAQLDSFESSPKRDAEAPAISLPEGELTLDSVIAVAVAQNPSVESARQHWRAALARAPQQGELPDPTLSYSLAPLSIFSSEVPYGQVVSLRQDFPFPGRRELASELELAESAARRFDYKAVQLRLAVLASEIYLALYSHERTLETYISLEKELVQHRRALTAHLAAGHAWQDDALKVELDLADIRHKRERVIGQRNASRAQLNQLLGRGASEELPTMPQTLEPPAKKEPGLSILLADAKKKRPELAAASSRVHKQARAVSLAKKKFYPSFYLSGSYNSMWASIEHELMVGGGLAIPLWREGRQGEVTEARAEKDRFEAERSATVLKVEAEVAQAFERLQASRKALAILETEVLPVAEQRIRALRLGLESGRTTFLEVLRADHELLAARLRYHNALADFHRYRISLKAATGELLVGESK